MSSCNLNTILKSWVKEQAYLPFSFPVSGCVCNAGSKGSAAILLYKPMYASLRFGFLFKSFFARFRKALSGLIVIVVFGVFDRSYKFLCRIARYGVGFFFSLQHSFHQQLTSFFPVSQVSCKSPQLMQRGFGKHRKHFLNMVYFINCCFHVLIITDNKKQVKGLTMDKSDFFMLRVLKKAVNLDSSQMLYLFACPFRGL